MTNGYSPQALQILLTALSIHRRQITDVLAYLPTSFKYRTSISYIDNVIITRKHDWLFDKQSLFNMTLSLSGFTDLLSDFWHLRDILITESPGIFKQERMKIFTIFRIELLFFIIIILSGVRLNQFGTGATTVPAPDDRWWWFWSNWWNEDWQEKL
jgi:hypothetical protein